MKQSIASEARYRQRVVKFSFKHGVLKAADRFRYCRQSIYNYSLAQQLPFTYKYAAEAKSLSPAYQVVYISNTSRFQPGHDT